MRARANRYRWRHHFVVALAAISAMAGLVAADCNVAWAAPAYALVKIKGADWTGLLGINDKGFALGAYTYSQTGNPAHGLVRSPDGTIATFDPPGSTNTYVYGINNDGAVTGEYSDSNGIHGFIRTLDGTISTFDVPGAEATVAGGINDADQVTGYYKDASQVFHGYLRSAAGSFTSFDAPNAFATTACCINKYGLVAGDDQISEQFRGYVRRTGGKIITFARITRTGTKNTFVHGLNDHGTIVGNYAGDHNWSNGFIRSPTGEITVVDVPGTLGTDLRGINDSDTSVGEYLIERGTRTRPPIYGAFVRAADGTIDTFTIPNFETASTSAIAINNSGVIVGVVGNQGFVRTP